MTYRAAGASNPNVKYIRSVEYLVTATDVLAIVNQHQLLGRYPTIEAAELAVEGCLIRHGVKNVYDALFRIPTVIINSGGDFTSTLNYANFTTTRNSVGGGMSCNGSPLQINDITRPIVLTFSNSNPNIKCYIKSGTTAIPANASIDPELDGYVEIGSNSNLVINPNDSTRLKARWVSSLTGSPTILGTTNLTITNKQDNFSKVVVITADEV
jgi:hypothetical protein